MREAEASRKRELVRWCEERLRKEYGEKIPPARRPDPLSELIRTVLSQNTNDRNRDRAWSELRRRYPTWEAVLTAPLSGIREAIRVGGLAQQKAERIQEMLRRIQDQEGRLELWRLKSMSTEKAREYLMSLKGVGEKTAACVLLFSLGRPVFPVDTHILRVSRRLGLLKEKTSAAMAHQVMGELVPEEAMYSFHLNLIEHGRQRCRPRKPGCGGCCLRAKCPSRGLA